MYHNNYLGHAAHAVGDLLLPLQGHHPQGPENKYKPNSI